MGIEVGQISTDPHQLSTKNNILYSEVFCEHGRAQPKSRMKLIQKYTLTSHIAQRSFMSASDPHDACTRANASLAICGMTGEG